MRGVQRMTALLAVALAVSCGGRDKESVRDSTASSDVQRDEAQCKYEAQAATASLKSTPRDNTTGGAISTGIADGIVIAERQLELVDACMRARGYRK